MLCSDCSALCEVNLTFTKIILGKLNLFRSIVQNNSAAADGKLHGPSFKRKLSFNPRIAFDF